MTSAVSRGDIVLVPFPFTDLSHRKIRPAIILNVLREDVLVAFISSVVPLTAPDPTDCVLTASDPAFPATGLKLTSVFKLAKILCLHQSLILRQIGHVAPALQKELDVRLARAVGLA